MFTKKDRDANKKSIQWNKKIKLLSNTNGYVYCINSKETLENTFKNIMLLDAGASSFAWCKGVFVFPATES